MLSQCSGLTSTLLGVVAADTRRVLFERVNSFRSSPRKRGPSFFARPVRLTLGPRFRGDERGESVLTAEALERAADEMVKGDRAGPVHEEIERRDGPHQGVFEAELVPEIFA